MRLFPVWLSFALLLPINAASSAPSFTLEQVMKAPFAAHLVSARGGQRVAWVVNAEGRRNIWVAEAKDWHGRQVTHFNEDDGQDIDDLCWSADGNALYFARGGDFENGRENPNPAAALARPEQAIWVMRPTGEPPRKLTEGRAPSTSPASTRVWFLRKDEIFSMNPDGSDAKTELEVQGSAEELTWSPDGQSVAFTNQRSTHSFVAVFTPVTKTVRFLDPSVDRDTSPAWSPDGKQIAFIRNAAQTAVRFFTPQREGIPWSIRVAAADGTTSRESFRAAAGPGSLFHAIASPQQLFWTAKDEVVFPWERTGWLHLYAIHSSGGAARELTPGDGEVEHVALSEDRKTLFYSSNIGDIDRRHIWKIAPGEHNAPKQISSGDSIECEPVPAGDAVAVLASNYSASSHAAMLESNGTTRDLAPDCVPGDFPARLLQKPEPVTVTAADGMSLHGQLFLPKGAGPHPALVFFHGGSRRQMLLGFHYMYYYSNAYAMNQYLASLGYVVLSVNYRSGIGYGLNFREALRFGAAGASEYNDVQGAGLYLKTRKDVDPKRIGVWGGSYGGYLTALALARSSDLFAAGVDFHGVHDWNLEIPNFDPWYDPRAHPDFARIAFESSPLSSVDTWRSPVLLIHGDDDRNVPFTETIRLVEELRQRNVPFEELIFPNEIHDFLLWRDWVKAYNASAEFFARKLKAD